jgi:hypothetical protein
LNKVILGLKEFVFVCATDFGPLLKAVKSFEAGLDEQKFGKSRIIRKFCANMNSQILHEHEGTFFA